MSPPAPLAGSGSQRLGEQCVLLHIQRLLAGFRGEERACHLQEVAEVEQLERLKASSPMVSRLK